MSERNNRLKCIEFSNPVDCYYIKHIAVPAEGAIAHPSFQDLGKIQIFRAVTGKYLGKTNNFSGSDMKNLGKVRSFRALTLNNYKNQLPNLGKVLFFS